jgi:hypothetical protein
MEREIRLNNEQKEILKRIINNSQGQGVNFLFAYESIDNPTKEITEWYNETRKEFKILEEIKELLK